MWARTITLVHDLHTRCKQLNNHPGDADAGYASEAVLVTALLIIGAIIVIGIIVAKVTSKANDINLALLILTVVP